MKGEEPDLMNKKVTVIYYLSQSGQKESIRQGGDGKQDQKFEADLTPELLEVSSVNKDGDIILDVQVPVFNNPLANFYGRTYFNQVSPLFDSPQTIEQLIAWKKEQIKASEEAEKKAKEEYEEALKKQQTSFVEPKPKFSVFDWIRGL